MFYLVTIAYILFLILWCPQPISLKAKPPGYWENFKSIKGTLILGVSLSIIFLLTSGFGFEKTNSSVWGILGTSKRGFADLSAYFQLVTNNFIHLNFIHLISNLGGLIYLSHYERRVGSGRYIMVFILSGIFSSIASLPFLGDMAAAGASAGVFGLAAAYFTDHKNLSKKDWLHSILAFAFIAVIFSLPDKSTQDMNIHHLGHFFGAVGGIIFCRLFPIPETDDEIRKRKKLRKIVAVIVPAFVILSIIPFVIQIVSHGKKTYDCASLYEEQKYEEAFDVCSKAIGPVAEGITAYFYENGFGVEKDAEKAFELFKKVAFRGDVNTQVHLATLYYSGTGVQQSYKKGFKWAKIAAEQNNRKAQLLVAGYYAAGAGIERDHQKAYMWTKVAEREDFNNTASDEEHEKVELLRQQAIERKECLEKKVAQKDSKESTIECPANTDDLTQQAAKLEEQGRKTIEVMGVKNARPPAKNNEKEYIKKNLSGLVSFLYPEQITKAIKLAKEWKPSYQEEDLASLYKEEMSGELDNEEEPELSDSPEMAGLCKYYYSRKNYKEAIGKCEGSSDQDAQKLTAVMYATGQGVGKNSEKAVEVINRSGNGDKIAAFYDFVGTMYYYDKDRDGVKKDRAEAIKWYERAAKAGDVKNQMRLAVWYYKGLFTAKKDFEESFKWAKMAAKQDHPQAQAMMVVFYGSGTGGVFKDDFHATWWLKKLVESVKLSNADQRYTDDEKKGALHWLRQFGVTECPHIIMKLATMYSNGGWGVEPIPLEGYGWYRQLAEAGYVDAKAQLGVIYFLGKIGKQNKKEAVRLLTAAADEGSAFAQRQLGNFYNMGDGVKKDMAKSIEWSTKAAENGDSYAQINIGNVYYYGIGTDKDYKQAYGWLLMAANQNVAQAQATIADMYSAGLGVEKDYVQSYMWSSLALEQEGRVLDRPGKRDLLSENVQKLLKQKIIDLTNNMSKEHVGIAKELTKAWKPSKSPNSAILSAHRLQGDEYFRTRKYDEAITAYGMVIEENPNDAVAYNHRGLLYKVLEKYEEALADLNEAIELDPKYVRAYNNRGVVHRRMGNFDKAIADYDKAAELNPFDGRSYSNRGVVYQQITRTDNNLQYSAREEGLRADPKHARMHLNAGVEYSNERNYVKAMEEYKKYLEYEDPYELDNDIQYVYRARATTYYSQGKYDLAVRDYKKSISYGNSEFKVYLALAIAYVKSMI